MITLIGSRKERERFKFEHSHELPYFAYGEELDEDCECMHNDDDEENEMQLYIDIAGGMYTIQHYIEEDGFWVPVHMGFERYDTLEAALEAYRDRG